MKFTSSGRTFVAAMIRSPSFSRSSSSSITTISPARIAATMSSVESRPDQAGSVFVRVTMPSQELHACARLRACVLFGGAEALEIASDDVDLNINSDAAPILANHRQGLRVRDDVHLERIAAHGVHGEAHAVDRDRALLCDIACEIARQPDPQRRRARGRRELDDLADAVDVAGHEMTVERVANFERRLEIHARADAELAERRDVERLARQIDSKTIRPRLDRGEADAAHRDAAAERERRHACAFERDDPAAIAAEIVLLEHASDAFDYAREHLATP